MRYITNAIYKHAAKRNHTIVILESNPLFESAFSNWMNGDMPTDSDEWKLINPKNKKSWDVYYGLNWEE